MNLIDVESCNNKTSVFGLVIQKIHEEINTNREKSSRLMKKKH